MSRLIQDGILSNKITQRYGIRDRVPLTMDSVISPVVIMDDLRITGDISASTLRATATGRQAAAGAGNFGKVRLNNPAGSNKLCVVKAFLPIVEGATDVQWVINENLGNLPGNPGTERFQRSAIYSNQFPVTRITNGFTGTVAAAPQGFVTAAVTLGTLQGNWIDCFELELEPDASITWEATVANIAMRISVLWTEEPLRQVFP